MTNDQYNRVKRWLKEAGEYVSGTIGYAIVMRSTGDLDVEKAQEAIKRLKKAERAICAAIQPFCGQMYEQEKED